MIVIVRDIYKEWAKGGCYIQFEASEFIEALRGKGNTTPTEEAADVLMGFIYSDAKL